ncbi:hypothetical protein Micbo1qcDRAFT_210398 [Microdochium bolleyi]|uniref:Uncharacterized protein n=1 Tax=Microdochium bolleyi TaxID=196109 RepID=A0A136IIM7_9PEZI|nr:hypothetical protein Micbo1qcDRAFT_210398 [Microdochium bolleyi]
MALQLARVEDYDPSHDSEAGLRWRRKLLWIGPGGVEYDVCLEFEVVGCRRRVLFWLHWQLVNALVDGSPALRLAQRLWVERDYHAVLGVICDTRGELIPAEIETDAAAPWSCENCATRFIRNLPPTFPRCHRHKLTVEGPAACAQCALDGVSCNWTYNAQRADDLDAEAYERMHPLERWIECDTSPEAIAQWERDQPTARAQRQ